MPPRETRSSAEACATMTCAVEDLTRRGFTADLRATGEVLRAASGEVLRPGDVVIREVHRFEGVSDPDDMEVVYAIESVSGVRGTLVDAFGVYADPATGNVLRDVPIREGGTAASDQPESTS